MRAPGRTMLEAWLAYHRALGFAHFFIYFDDPEDPDLELVAKQRDVTAVPRDAALMRRVRRYSLWSSMGRFAESGSGGDRTMARQVLFVQDALARIASEHLAFDWLLHIDHDELIVVPGNDIRSHFTQLAAMHVDQAIYINHEAVPEQLEIDDVFREVTLFKRNPATVARLRGRRAAVAAAKRFVAYMVGKAAIRVDAGAIPDGVHRFTAGARPIETRVLESPCVLHYPGIGFTRWRAKYQQLGEFGDRWFEGDPIRLAFHLKSRDLREQPDSIASIAYRRHAMLGSPARRERLRERGDLVRIAIPRRILGRRGL